MKVEIRRADVVISLPGHFNAKSISLLMQSTLSPTPVTTEVARRPIARHFVFLPAVSSKINPAIAAEVCDTAEAILLARGTGLPFQAVSAHPFWDLDADVHFGKHTDPRAWRWAMGFAVASPRPCSQKGGGSITVIESLESPLAYRPEYGADGGWWWMVTIEQYAL